MTQNDKKNLQNISGMVHINSFRHFCVLMAKGAVVRDYYSLNDIPLHIQEEGVPVYLKTFRPIMIIIVQILT